MKRTILIICLTLLTGCTFTRHTKVCVEGAKAQKYGAVDGVIIDCKTTFNLFRKGE